MNKLGQWLNVIRGTLLLMVLLIPAIPGNLSAQNAATTRAATAALVGRASLSPEEQQVLDRLVSFAIQEPEVMAALGEFEPARVAYQENQRKFPADRDREVATRYRQATAKVVAELRAAMIAHDSEAAEHLFSLLRTPDPAIPGNLSAQNAATTRAASAALVGRASLSPEEQQVLDRLVFFAVQEPEVMAALGEFEPARLAYQENQRKFPADRDREVATRYRQATAKVVTALRGAMIAYDPETSEHLFLLLRNPDSPNQLALAPIEDRAGLPRVLLIGDSISMGYTLEVRARLQGVANVHRIPINGGATEVGLANIDSWLGESSWDVIHFNFGLHDAKYFSRTEQRASREEYLGNLQLLVDRMKTTGAALIFATTTPIPEMLQYGTATGLRVFDSISARNALAIELMERNEVLVNDLYTVIAESDADITRPHDVHFPPEGYAVLAERVSECIQGALTRKGK
jgi:lysophospholipase L1-like esterase